MRTVDIETGEKYAYPHMLVLDAIKEGFVPRGITYDINCRFTPYLRTWEGGVRAALNEHGCSPTDTELKDSTQTVAGFTMGIGSFHAWTHQVS